MASLAWNPAPPDWQTPTDPRTRSGAVSPYYTGYETGEELRALLPAAQQVNQANLQYLAGGIPNYANLTATESGNIANLLNPTNFAEQQRQAAEKAVSGGFQGSGLANQLGYNLTEDEKIRRQQIGSQMLSGAAGRLPAPFNPASLLQPGQRPTAVAPGVASISGPGGAPPGTSPGLTPGGPPPNPPGAMGTPTRGSSTGNIVSDILSRYGVGGAAPDPMAAWAASVGVGGPNPNVNPYTGYADYNTEFDPISGQHVAVDQYGQPIDYNPVSPGTAYAGADQGVDFSADYGSD